MIGVASPSKDHLLLAAHALLVSRVSVASEARLSGCAAARPDRDGRRTTPRRTNSNAVVITTLDVADFGVQQREDHLRAIGAIWLQRLLCCLSFHAGGSLLLAAHLPPAVAPHRVDEPT